ncbi:MAG: hypothetical protein ACUVRK_06620 [Spirochaetota bacterium]
MEKSLAITNNQPAIHLETGKWYYFFSEYLKAISHVQKALAKKNDLVYAHYYLVCIYNVQKNYEAAALNINTQSGVPTLSIKQLTCARRLLELTACAERHIHCF